MGPLGIQEIVLIFIIALVLFGPKKLPELGKSIGKALGELPELLQQHPMDRQKYPQALKITDRAQSSAKQHAVETCYSTDDAVLMPLQKSLHGFLRMWFRQTHHARSSHGALPFFGCGQTAALRWLCVSASLRLDSLETS